MRLRTCLVTGAAGFIGSHLVDRLLAGGRRVIGVDNFRLGTRANLQAALSHPGFVFLEADVNDYAGNVARLEPLASEGGIDEVWHLAANSDIRAGTEDSEVDLRDTFLTTFNTLRLAKILGIRQVAFASSSAIYGAHDAPLAEDRGPWHPISNYGAMKLASEALLSAALETALEQTWIFRFPNVVGSRATHGVILDFLQRLHACPEKLVVLGNGQQQKPYLHVAELVDALLFIREHAGERLNCYNIGPAGSTTTVRYIAEAVVRRVAPAARIEYGLEARGWPGDVPRFTYAIDKLGRLGWAPQLTSDAAVDRAIAELAP